MMKKTSLILTLISLFFSFVAHSEPLNTGPWRFELRSTYGRIPFVITLNKKNNTYSGTLHNGKENIPLTDIKLNKKELSIPLQTYEMSLEMKIEAKNLMSGFLIRHNKNPKVKTPVLAAHGFTERFPEEKKKAAINLDGKWAVTLKDEENKESPGILVFDQNENKLSGSLLTTTGDYRYFEGFVSGSEFEAASFDGVYNYLIKGKLKKDKIEGAVRSNYLVKFKGKKNDKAELPDAYKHTQIVKPLKFKFSNLQGKLVSLDDDQFKNKPVIVQIYGSWCPNCMDEINFLIPWYKENKDRGIEIIALAFERSINHAQATAQLKKVQKKKEIPYTLLLAGSTAEDKPEKLLPGLKNFISFPTTVFLNKEHEVVKVHAGFSGPSTGEFYEKWKSEFNATVDSLLK